VHLNQHLGLKEYRERKIKYCYEQQKKLYEIRAGGYYAVNILLKGVHFPVGQIQFMKHQEIFCTAGAECGCDGEP